MIVVWQLAYFGAIPLSILLALVAFVLPFTNRIRRRLCIPLTFGSVAFGLLIIAIGVTFGLRPEQTIARVRGTPSISYVTDRIYGTYTYSVRVCYRSRIWWAWQPWVNSIQCYTTERVGVTLDTKFFVVPDPNDVNPIAEIIRDTNVTIHQECDRGMSREECEARDIEEYGNEGERINSVYVNYNRQDMIFVRLWNGDAKDYSMVVFWGLTTIISVVALICISIAPKILHPSALKRVHNTHSEKSSPQSDL